MGSHGYYVANLTRNGRQKVFCVHRLVAETFLPPDEARPDVNHKDLNYQNNVVSNLEWVTHQENLIHARDGGRLNGHSNPKRRFKLQPDQVADIRLAAKCGEKHQVIASRFGVSRRMVSMIHAGKRWCPQFEADFDARTKEQGAPQ